MDLSKLMRNEFETFKLIVVIDGEETEWEYRRMSWHEKTDCLSKALTMNPQADGSAAISMNMAAYYLEALQKMLVKAPGGIPISATMLKNLSDEVGTALQEIVPAPFGTTKKEETLKKD